jgi:hypothetical protein
MPALSAPIAKSCRIWPAEERSEACTRSASGSEGLGHPTLPGTITTQPSEPTGAARALQLAARYATAAGTTARPDQFLFVESIQYGTRVTWVMDSPTGRVLRMGDTETRQVLEWASVDGTHDGLERARRYEPPGPWGSQPVPGCRNGTWAPTVDRPSHQEECSPQGQPTGLPTDEAGMLRYLYQTGDDQAAFVTGDQAAFARVATVVRGSLDAPAVLGAVFQAAAMIPGVPVLDDAVDRTGRHGVAVVLTDDELRQMLIFDATTYQYLGSRTVTVANVSRFGSGTVFSPPLRAGTELSSDAILRHGIVDRPGQLP